MKILRTLLAVSVIGLASVSSANARDSFSFGLNIGGYGPPPVVSYYHPAPPVVYYGAPAYYYAPQPYYYGPRASYSFSYDNRHHHRHHGWGHRGWGRDDRGHRGDHGHRGHH